MFTDLTHVTILVDDQDEALDYYTNTLGFEARDDSVLGEGMRWLTVAPPNADRQLVLVAADTPEKQARVGSQVADHVAVVVETDDCVAEYERLRENGVEFHGEPEAAQWGVSAVFEDLYGNVFNLVEPAEHGEMA